MYPPEPCVSPLELCSAAGEPVILLTCLFFGLFCFLFFFASICQDRSWNCRIAVQFQSSAGRQDQLSLVRRHEAEKKLITCRPCACFISVCCESALSVTLREIPNLLGIYLVDQVTWFHEEMKLCSLLALSRTGPYESSLNCPGAPPPDINCWAEIPGENIVEMFFDSLLIRNKVKVVKFETLLATCSRSPLPTLARYSLDG